MASQPKKKRGTGVIFSGHGCGKEVDAPYLGAGGKTKTTRKKSNMRKGVRVRAEKMPGLKPKQKSHDVG